MKGYENVMLEWKAVRDSCFSYIKPVFAWSAPPNGAEASTVFDA